VIVVDADGNIVTGTHTMESPAWGEGFFVDGVALATSAPYIAGNLKPGTKLLDPLSTEIVFQEGQPRLVLGTYGTGLSPADVQVMSGLADYGLNPEQAVLEPRLGWFAVNPLSHHPDPTVNLLDPRVPRDVVCELLRRGVEVRQRDEASVNGLIDLGYPMVVKINTNKLQAMVPELSQGEAVGY
jgi:gamma-glutamyltranspeptidase